MGNLKKKSAGKRGMGNLLKSSFLLQQLMFKKLNQKNMNNIYLNRITETYTDESEWYDLNFETA